MGLWDFLILLAVAGVCGAVAQSIAGFTRGGCLVAVAVGFIGAMLGLWLQRLTGLPELLTLDVDGTRFPIVWSILGGVLFAVIVGMFTRPSRRDLY